MKIMIFKRKPFKLLQSMFCLTRESSKYKKININYFTPV